MNTLKSTAVSRLQVCKLVSAIGRQPAAESIGADPLISYRPPFSTESFTRRRSEWLATEIDVADFSRRGAVCAPALAH